MDIICPACGFSPRNLARQEPEKNTALRTREDELDYFEVLGCDDGNVMCPECACELGPDQGVLIGKIKEG